MERYHVPAEVIKVQKADNAFLAIDKKYKEEAVVSTSDSGIIDGVEYSIYDLAKAILEKRLGIVPVNLESFIPD
jgi:hypothetical protein